MWVEAINRTQRATGWPEIGELEIPGISVNTSSMAENVDSVAAICHTSATDDKWYVSYTQVSNYDPDSKTLIIQRVSIYNTPLQCGMEILPHITERSEMIFLTVIYGPSSVLIRSKPGNLNGELTAEIGSSGDGV